MESECSQSSAQQWIPWLDMQQRCKALSDEHFQHGSQSCFQDMLWLRAVEQAWEQIGLRDRQRGR